MKRKTRRGLRGTQADHLATGRATLQNAKDMVTDDATCGTLLRAYGRAMNVAVEAAWAGDVRVGHTTIDAGRLAMDGQALEDRIAKRIHETCFCKPKRKR